MYSGSASGDDIADEDDDEIYKVWVDITAIFHPKHLSTCHPLMHASNVCVCSMCAVSHYEHMSMLPAIP